MAERCIQTVKLAMKKAMQSGRDVDLSLLCLRSTPIDHAIPSPGELLYNRKLISNLPTKCINNNTRREEIRDRLLQRQLIQKVQNDQHAKDLPALSTGQQARVQDPNTRNWTPAVITQACTEPRSYLIKTPTGQVLRRNRRHLREDESRANKALIPQPETPRSKPPQHPASIPPVLNTRSTPNTSNTQNRTCTRSGQIIPPKIRSITTHN